MASMEELRTREASSSPSPISLSVSCSAALPSPTSSSQGGMRSKGMGGRRNMSSLTSRRSVMHVASTGLGGRGRSDW